MIVNIQFSSYPFYGVQFHPEKNLYEWKPNRNVAHSENAVKSAQYFARFFVDECRKNGNHFDSINEENQMLIYNFPTTFTARVKSSFDQCYLFKTDVDYVKPDGFENVSEEDIDDGL